MDDDPCFLAQFPRDRLLDRFAHLDKARERRIATGREPRLAAKQDMIVMDRKHDDDRVGSRKMIRLATVAAPCPTAPGDVRRNAAVRAERSEERRVGKECVSTCRSRWSPSH